MISPTVRFTGAGNQGTILTTYHQFCWFVFTSYSNVPISVQWPLPWPSCHWLSLERCNVVPQLHPTSGPQAARLIFIKPKQITGLGCVPVYSSWLAYLCVRTQCVILFAASKTSCGPACFLFTLLPTLYPRLTKLLFGPWCSAGFQGSV